jgi:Ternary complex associated domain 9
MAEKRVVIADSNKDRAEALRQLIAEQYEAEVERIEHWDVFEKKFSLKRNDDEEELGKRRIEVLILAWYLDPKTSPKFVLQRIADTTRDYDVGKVVVLGCPNPSAIPRESEVRCLPSTGNEVSDEDVGKALHELLAPHCPLPKLDVDKDCVLEAQISSLGAGGSVEEGMECLRFLIRDLWQCGEASIERLTQGLSGDLVLKVVLPEGGEQAGRFVLKISKERFGRLQKEAENWGKLEAQLNKGGGLDSYVTRRVRPKKAMTGSAGLVAREGWHAVAYGLLGEPAGQFATLRAVYVGGSSDRKAEDAIEDAINHLSGVWYEKGKSEERTLWGSDDPVFAFSLAWKARLLGRLESLGPLYERSAGPEAGAADLRSLRDWIVTGPGFPMRGHVLLSPIHGDLNCGNILIWTDNKGRPFFIDFANYTDSGPSLTDLAHLESQVKFLLMDAENDNALPFLDHTPGQLPHWQRMDRSLSSPDPAGAVTGGPGVQRAFAVCRWLREKAGRICQQVRRSHPGAEGRPPSEYLAALAYHTLRVIGYEDVPPMKRLFAIHSAARLVEDLEGRFKSANPTASVRRGQRSTTRVNTSTRSRRADTEE